MSVCLLVVNAQLENIFLLQETMLSEIDFLEV